jgi:O-antigen/teichoic acid export membrane protein
MLGAEVIGQWNRAEVLATLPFQQLQSALLPVVYPEFRHDRAGASRAQRKWADMISLVAWVTIPAGVVGAVLLPHLLPILLGDQWQQAALFTIPLALAGGLQPPTVLLAAAIEAIGKFRVIWLVNAVVFASQLTAVALVFLLKSPWPAVCALLVMNLLSHALYASWAGRRGYLDTHALARSYRSLFAACAWLGLALLAFERLFIGATWMHIAAASVLAVSGVGLWRGFSAHGLEWLPPYRMAQRLGALRSRRPAL